MFSAGAVVVGVAPRGILLMILHGVYIKLNLIRHFTEAYFIEFSSHPNHCTVIFGNAYY